MNSEKEALLVVGSCPDCEVLTYYDKPVIHKGDCRMVPMLEQMGLNPYTEDRRPGPIAEAFTCASCGGRFEKPDAAQVMMHVAECAQKHTGKVLEMWTRCEACGERVLASFFAKSEHAKTCLHRPD